MGLKAMKVLYKMIIALFLITLSTAVSAASVWDGSVSIARYGYLPQKGMYAASNAFPKKRGLGTVDFYSVGVFYDLGKCKTICDG